MIRKFGIFDTVEELNRAAAAQKAEGDEEALFALAAENGIGQEDVRDYLDGEVEELATPLMAAVGKLDMEAFLAAGLKHASQNRVRVPDGIVKKAGIPQINYIGMTGRDELRRIAKDYYVKRVAL